MKPKSLIPLVLLLSLFATARAATITVTSSGDSGAGTLRQAIIDANDGDTVQFASGISPVALTSGEILINKNLMIQGPGASKLTVQRDSGAGRFRIFHLRDSKTLTISGLTISGGDALDGDGIEQGGVLRTDTGGTLTINDCVLSGNHANGYGGALYFGSTGSPRGTLNVNNTTFSGNTASDGGAIFPDYSDVTISNSTLTGNTVAGGGGAIYATHASGVTVNNSTLSGNSAGSGGGIFNDGYVVVNNSTVVGNSATSNGGGLGRNPGGGAQIFLNSTIVANNTAGGLAPDCYYVINGGDYNLIKNTSDLYQFPGSHNITGQDPLLGPLANNGGPTKTRALQPGSPAINAGVSSTAFRDDQRGAGYARRFGTATVSGGDGTDIGAYEVQSGSIVYDAVRDFSAFNNDPQQAWQYGFTAVDGTGFTNFSDTSSFTASSGGLMQSWHTDSVGPMGIAYNTSGTDQSYNICTLQQPDVLGLFPNPDGRKAVVRWVAPVSGSYSFQGRFQNIDHATSDATIVRNGDVQHPVIDPIYINSPNSCHNTDVVVPFTFTITVNAGDTIDFRLGWGQNNQYNYDGTGFAVTITGVPTAPTHGGLSTTPFQVNLSSSPGYPPAGSPVTGLAGAPFLFTAQQSALAGDVSVRVQTTTTPATESSWTDLNDANSGRMTYSSNFQVFGLFSLSYPEQNGVYFRAITSAGGYPDSISNVVGPFDLASSKPLIGSTRLDFTGNGSIADLYFRATESATVTGMTVRVQTSTNPDDEGSWSDLASGGMTQSTDPKQFLLLYNNFPTTANVYFRAIASASGYTDSISNMMGPFNITHAVPPVVTLNPPAGLNNADGHDPKNPILVPYGFYSFGATVTTTRSLKSLKFQVDGETRTTFTNGEKEASITTIDALGSFHVMEAVAVDDQNVTARLGTAPVFIKIVRNPNGSTAKAENGPTLDDASSTHLYHVAANGGIWTDASTWVDENGNNGVPTRLDSVEIGDNTIYFSGDGEAQSVSINGGFLVGSATLNIYGTMDVGGMLVRGSMVLEIEPGATANLNNPSYVTFLTNPPFDNFTGTFFVDGTLNLHGSGGMVGMQKIENHGTINFLPELQVPPQATIDPKAAVRLLQADTFTNRGLIASPITALLTQDGSNLITQDGGSLITQDGGSLITQDGGSLITQDGGSIVAAGAGNIVATGAGNIVAAGAGNIVAAGAGNFHGARTAAAASPTGFIQTAGETNLSAVTVVGNVTLNGGIISGTGFIQGNLTNNGGFVAPGHSAGAIAVLGNFAQSSNGTTILEMGGAKGGQFDSLQISGAATLGGKLDLKLINSYQPDPADTSNPIAYKSVSGGFSSISSNAHVAMNTTGILATMNSSIPNPLSGQPTNISTRMNVQTNDNVLIGGFIVSGPSGSTKKVLIHGLGPSLSSAHLTGLLSDPLLEFHYPNGTVVINDNWGDAPNKDQIPDGFAPKDPRESILILDLPPAVYTVMVKGAHGETGIGMTEVYDIDGSTTVSLTNVSTRGLVQTGDSVMIGGFIVGGSEPATMLLKVPGPSLKNPPASLTGVLEDPMLELHDSNGNVITNDDWRQTQEAEIIATTLAPNNDKEPAILATLTPGVYTAIVKGKNNTTGIAIVEAYKVK